MQHLKTLVNSEHYVHAMIVKFAHEQGTHSNGNHDIMLQILGSLNFGVVILTY